MPKAHKTSAGINGQAGSTSINGSHEMGDPTVIDPLAHAAAELANRSEKWSALWQGMPEFTQRDLSPWKSVTVHFDNRASLDDFAAKIGQTVLPTTRSVWHPQAEIGRLVTKRYAAPEPRMPRFPIYVISKGRWESRLTVKSLIAIGAPFRVVVEPQERDAYASVIDPKLILTLPFCNLGQGSIPARNWVWEHSISEGHERHWILDDNIDGFFRLNRNLKTPVGCPTIFAAAEDFVERFDNVGEAGFNYFMFASRKTRVPPIYLNTRIYSCILLRNDLTHRWRGRYNEDTDLSLRILKSGLCTILFNAFLAMKQTTMTMSGGNSDELYQGDGRLKMAESLAEQHPDVARISHKWGRPQHHVDYRPFAKNELRLKSGLVMPVGVDEHGMHLQDLIDGVWVSRDEEKAQAERRELVKKLEAVAGKPPQAAGFFMGRHG